MIDLTDEDVHHTIRPGRGRHLAFCRRKSTGETWLDCKDQRLSIHGQDELRELALMLVGCYEALYGPLEGQ